jgi:hypothetical protein
MKITKAQRSELIAGMIEGAITAAVVMVIFMMAMGVRAFVCLIPAIVLFAMGAAGVALGVTLITYRKVVNWWNESTYTKYSD